MAVDIKARNIRQNNWQKENTDRINFTMPKGRKEEIRKCADAEGVSASEWINQAIIEKMAGCGSEMEFINVSSIKDLGAYAKSAGVTMKEYVFRAIAEAMSRQDAEVVEDMERVNIEE